VTLPQAFLLVPGQRLANEISSERHDKHRQYDSAFIYACGLAVGRKLDDLSEVSVHELVRFTQCAVKGGTERVAFAPIDLQPLSLYRAKLNGRNRVELASLPSIAQPVLVSVA
jgi:hypothetical protein